MDVFIEYYTQHRNYKDNIGTYALFDSYLDFKGNSSEFQDQWPMDLTLQEKMWDKKYGVAKKHHIWSCNCLVARIGTKTAVFYSRIVGAGEHCPG